MMNILYIVPNPPSLVRVRPYNLVRHLCSRGHQITVATVWSNAEERSDVEHLRAQGIEVIAVPLPKGQVMRNLLRALGTGVPLQAYYAYSPTLAQQVQRLLTSVEGQRFDLIHIEHLRGAQYGLAIRNPSARLRTGSRFAIPIVWDSVDCITYLFEQAAAHSRSRKGRLMARLELARTRRHEARLVRGFQHTLVTSPIDKAALEELADGKLQIADSKRWADAWGQSNENHLLAISHKPYAISLLPNGVDLAYFTPADKPREPAAIIFSGKMSYHANVTAALHLVNDIIPHVWAQRPDVQVWIVGKDPSREIRALAGDGGGPSAVGGRVTVTGTVPDIRPYLRRATLAVAPLSYGAGIQNKVLEAMACGTPVVVSPQAVSALEAVAGEHLLVADDATTFAQHILDLLADQAWQRRLGMAGRRYVEQHHDWDRIAECLEQIYTAVLASALNSPLGRFA